MKKKIFALVLALVMILSLAACSNSNAGNEPEESKAPVEESQAPVEESKLPQDEVQEIPEGSSTRELLRIAGSDDPATLDPWAGSASGMAGMAHMIYETFCIAEHGHDLEPCLAKSWSQDGETLTIELFDNIKDSAGNPLTASDVVFSLDKCLEEGMVTYTKIMTDYKAVDDYTVEITLKLPLTVGDLETFLTNVYIVTEAGYEASGDAMYSNAIGTGRYSVESFDQDTSLVLVKRDDYWQTDESQIASRSQANVERIEYTYVSDASQRSIAAQTGSADVAMQINYTDVDTVEAVDGITVYPYQMSQTWLLMPNCDEASPLSDVNLRKAVFYAIDNEGVAQFYTSGKATAVYDMSNSNYTDYYEDYYKQLAEEGSIYKYDTALAKEYLEKSNYNGETLIILCASLTGPVDMATVVLSYLEEIGIKSEIRQIQNNLLTEETANPANWDLYIRTTASNSYATVAWDRPLNPKNYASGLSCNFIPEGDPIYEMQASTTTEEGHTEEAVKEEYQWIVDNAYGYGMIVVQQYMAVPEDCTFVSFNLSLMPSFCSFQFA